MEARATMLLGDILRIAGLHVRLEPASCLFLSNVAAIVYLLVTGVFGSFEYCVMALN